MKSLTGLIQKLFKDRFLTLAILLSGLFLSGHLLGFREYTNILSGTGVLTMRHIYGGMIYILLYVCVIGIVPILLIADALRYGMRRIQALFASYVLVLILLISFTAIFKRINIIQKVCDALPSSTYRQYMSSWNGTSKKADDLEKEHPVLVDYLRTATIHTIQNIRQTRIKRGLALWHVYNMGYVFKTPETCFGIDLHGRDLEMLANNLDFLLITHNHKDHYSEPLLKAMITAKKPVITRWYAG